ncbi:YoaK family protein [Mucilaginibacter sabulilitoris]|uniref:YoaK family protein n=1 Tax=Mucilaginibacter sabulilitoris TaxID=1173583 RepID=A0ABZ0TNG1_9SPHI|nr:YoaK family protein [Mucilaginibacter sabulilitoris]WPU93982.1 YoaK family protein [Mucilaginibacter sabulilitoris]
MAPEAENLPSVNRDELPVQVYSDNSIEVAALLTLSGGFLDVFTYIGHGHVFANSMTGNVVFLGMYAATGNWHQAMRHIPPIVAFLAGVLIAYRMHLPSVLKYFPKPALTCLGLEIIVLIAASFLSDSFPDVLLVLAIALVAAMQNSNFTKLELWTYNSVMTTGNLRRFAEAFFRGTMPGLDRVALREARLFGFVCLCFLAGAILAALTTPRLHDYSLFIPAGVLFIAFIICWRRQKARFLYPIIRYKSRRTDQ